MALFNYVLQNTRVAPSSASKNPTVNLTLATIEMIGGDKKEFIKLVGGEFPRLLNGKRHNFQDIEKIVGNRNITLRLIGLGHLLRVWEASSPDLHLPHIHNLLKRELANRGTIFLITNNKGG